ncbi:hypothetical protein Dimus_016222, partial [Dionaea muscipula]
MAINGTFAYLDANQTGIRSSQDSSTDDRPIWKTPYLGWIKVNFDGSYNAKKGRGGISIICRTHEGNFPSTRVVPLSFVDKPLISEILATRAGISMALEM